MDTFVESPNEYSRFDAYNSKHIVEIKERFDEYDPTIIEFDKFAYNKAYSEWADVRFLYLVYYDGLFSLFNISKLISEGFDFRWEWRKMPKTTDFYNNDKILKFIGYIPFSMSKQHRDNHKL